MFCTQLFCFWPEAFVVRLCAPIVRRYTKPDLIPRLFVMLPAVLGMSSVDLIIPFYPIHSFVECFSLYNVSFPQRDFLRRPIAECPCQRTLIVREKHRIVHLQPPVISKQVRDHNNHSLCREDLPSNPNLRPSCFQVHCPTPLLLLLLLPKTHHYPPLAKPRLALS